MQDSILNESITQALFQSRLEDLPEEERSVPSQRDKIFHDVVGRDGHGYTLAYGSGIPRSVITRAESSGASSSQGGVLHTGEEVEQLLQSMEARIREQVRTEMRAEMRAELRAEWRSDMEELEARISQSRSPLISDPPPTSHVSIKNSFVCLNYQLRALMCQYLCFFNYFLLYNK
jgi:hypothetical protein